MAVFNQDVKIKHYVLPRQCGKSTRIVRNSEVSSGVNLIIAYDERQQKHLMSKIGQQSDHYWSRTNVIEYDQLGYFIETGKKSRRLNFLFGDIRPDAKINIYIDELLLATGRSKNKLSFRIALSKIFEKFPKENINVEAYSSVGRRYDLFDYIKWLTNLDSKHAQFYFGAFMEPEFIDIPIPDGLNYEQTVVNRDERLRSHGLQRYVAEYLTELFTMGEEKYDRHVKKSKLAL